MRTGGLADHCAQAVMETVPHIMRAIREQMRRQNSQPLSIPQLRTLAYLHHHPGACLFLLAEHLGVTRPTASSILDRLVRRGMVTRVADPRERRRLVLTLTPVGEEHLRAARQATQAWMGTVLSRLSRPKLMRILQGMALLREPFPGPASEDGP